MTAADSQGPAGMLYPERDSAELGNYYTRHVDRMTVEGLHAKSDIAAQLGWRDREIDRLKQQLATVEADARRYRHLRGNGVPQLCVLVEGLPSYLGATPQDPDGPKLDAVIDSAIGFYADLEARDAAMADAATGAGVDHGSV